MTVLETNGTVWLLALVAAAWGAWLAQAIAARIPQYLPPHRQWQKKFWLWLVKFGEGFRSWSWLVGNANTKEFLVGIGSNPNLVGWLRGGLVLLVFFSGIAAWPTVLWKIGGVALFTLLACWLPEEVTRRLYKRWRGRCLWALWEMAEGIDLSFLAGLPVIQGLEGTAELVSEPLRQELLGVLGGPLRSPSVSVEGGLVDLAKRLKSHDASSVLNRLAANIDSGTPEAGIFANLADVLARLEESQLKGREGSMIVFFMLCAAWFMFEIMLLGAPVLWWGQRTMTGLM